MGVMETPRPLSSICRGAGTWSGKVTLSPLPVPKVTHIAPKTVFEKKRELKPATIGDPTTDHVPKTFATRHGALLLFADSYKTWRSQLEEDEPVAVQDQNEKIVQQLKSLKELRSLVLSFGLDDENVIKRISSILQDDSLIQVQPGFTPNRYTSSAVQLWDPQLVDKYLENDGINKSVVDRYFELLLPDVTVNGIVLKDTLLGSRPRRFNSFLLPEIRIDPRRRAAMERQQRMSQVRRNPQVMVLPKIDFTHDSYLPDNVPDTDTEYFQKHMTRNKMSEQSQRKFWDNYENLSYDEKADLLYRMLVTTKSKDSGENEGDDCPDNSRNKDASIDSGSIFQKKDRDQRKCIFPDLAITTYDPPKIIPEFIHRVQLPNPESHNEINDLPPIPNPSINVTCSPEKASRDIDSENNTRNSVNVLSNALPKDVETSERIEHPKFAYRPTKLTAYGVAHTEQCQNMMREGRRKDLMILGTSFTKSEDHITLDGGNETYDSRPSSFPSFLQNKAGRFGAINEITSEDHPSAPPKQHVPLHYTTISSPYNLDSNAKRFTNQTKETRYDRVINSTTSSLAGDFDSYRREESDMSLFPGYAATDRSRNSSTLMNVGRGSSQHSIPFATNESNSPGLSDRKLSSADGGISPRSCISIVQECNKSDVSEMSSLKNSNSVSYTTSDDRPPPYVDKYDNVVHPEDRSKLPPISSTYYDLTEKETYIDSNSNSTKIESSLHESLDGSQASKGANSSSEKVLPPETSEAVSPSKEDDSNSIYDREASMVPEIIANIDHKDNKKTTSVDNNADLKPGSLEHLEIVVETSSESGIDAGCSIDNNFSITGYISAAQVNITPSQKEHTQESISLKDDEGISIDNDSTANVLNDGDDITEILIDRIGDKEISDNVSKLNEAGDEITNLDDFEDDVSSDDGSDGELVEGRESTIQVFIKTPSYEKTVSPKDVPREKVDKGTVTWEDEEVSPRNSGESVSDLGSSVSGTAGEVVIEADESVKTDVIDEHPANDVRVVDTNDPIASLEEYADERDSFASSSLKNISSSTLGDEALPKDDVTKPTSAGKGPTSADKGRLSVVVYEVLGRPESGYDLTKDLHAVKAELSKESSFVRVESSKQDEKKLESLIEKVEEPVVESPKPQTKSILEEKEKTEPFRVGTAMEEKPKFLDNTPVATTKKSDKKTSTTKKKTTEKKGKENAKKSVKKAKLPTPSLPKTTKQTNPKLPDPEPVLKPAEETQSIPASAPPVLEDVQDEKQSPRKPSKMQDKQKTVPNKRASIQSELSRSNSESPYQINRSPESKEEELPAPIPEKVEVDKKAERERVLAHKKKREKSAAERRAEMEKKRKLLEEKRRLEREEKLLETELYLQKIQDEELRNQQLQSEMEEELRRQEEERRRLAQLEKEKLEAEEMDRMKREEEGEKSRKKKMADEEAQRRKMEILMAERQMELEFKRAQEEMARAIEADMREQERLLMEQMAEEERRAYEEQKRLEEALRAKEDAERAAQLAQKRKEEEERREAELEELMRVQARQLFTSSARKTNRLLEIQQQVSRAYTYSYYNLLPIILYGNSNTPSSKKKGRKVPNLANVLSQLEG